MQRFRLPVAVCALLLCSRSGAQDAQVWDRVILPQPYDKAPFQQVRIPDWVEDTIGCGYTLSVMDGNARAAAARHGVTISEMGFVNPFFACYESKLIEGRHPDFPPGRVEQDIAEYKKLGVRILAVYPPCLQGEVYRKHPEWRRIGENTKEIPSIDMDKYPHGGMLCLLGPYGDFFIDVLSEILTRFPEVDAFSFDGLHYAGFCYCGSCRENYRNETGKELPKAPDLNDPEFRRYQHWADRRMENLIQRMQTRLKGIKPEVALVTWTTNAGRWGHFLSIPRNMPTRMNLLLDAPDQEFWLDETNRGTTIVPALANAYIWATTNHRVAFSEPYILSHGNPYGKDSFPPAEIQRRMLLALTHGAQPSIAVAQPSYLQEHLYECMDEVHKRKPWLTHKKPERWAAMVLSDNTRNFYGRAAGLVEERYMANVLGTFRAAVEEHLPVAIINDWNLNSEDLHPYKVLILPNTACLDDTQVAAIKDFVKEGGGLVASLDTSLFNEFGDPRENFALREVFGVDYRGLPEVVPVPSAEPLDVNFAKSIPSDYWEKRKSVFDFRQNVDSFLNQGNMRVYVGPDPVTFKGPAVRVSLLDSQAQVVGTMATKDAAGAAPQPAILARTYGRGRVVYFAAGLDAGYYLYPYPYQRLVLKNAIEWAASAPKPVTIAAPMCVQSSVMRQTRAGERLVVHLFNELNTTAHHALPSDDVPLREETVPIHDISVTFDAGYRIKRAHLEPLGLDLPIEITPGGKRVFVPRLDVHAMVVAELEAAE
jgi:hypothetical protein